MPSDFILKATFLVLAAIAPACAQTITGSISGSVRDPGDAAVPGADVALVHATTGALRGVTTNEAGDFVFTGVQPGEYRLTVKAAGFRPLERRNLNLTASERLAAGNLVLEIGALEEQVTVTAQTAAVQTVSAERSSAITSSQVENLLIRGRNVTALLSLLPGVVDPADGQGEQPQANNMSNFNVNGGRQNSNNVTFDGLNVVQTGNSPHGYIGVSMDSVSEVKVMLSNYQAEFGRLSGASIQVVSKSGTRDFHGMASYFKRHEQFNASNFFNNRNGQAKGRYRYNTWTYNIGGPIYIPGKFNRDRSQLFFFWNQEFWPQQTPGGLRYATMPTELERRGDFSRTLDVSGALIPVYEPGTRRPFPGNIIPASRLDPNGAALLKVFPQPNFSDIAVSRRNYNHVSQFGNETPFQLPTLKLDYNRTSDMISFTWAGEYQTTRGANVGGLNPPFPLFDATQKSGGKIIAIRYQHIFSPRMVNELTGGYLYRFTTARVDEASLPTLQRPTYGITLKQLNPSSNPLNFVPEMILGGVPGAPNIDYSVRFPNDNWRRTWNLSDNFSFIAGSHTLKAGFFFDRMVQGENTYGDNFTGRFDFGRNVNNPLDTNWAFSNAALGIFNSYQEISMRPVIEQISNGFEWWVQDNWKITRKLTLDYGVRFQWFQPFWSPDNHMTSFVPGRFDRTRQVQLIRPVMAGGRRSGVHPVTGEIYPAALIGAIAPGTGDPRNGTVVVEEDASYPRGLMETPGLLAAPRFGFAYDPFGDGKTAIRGGGGIFYNRLLGFTLGVPADYPLTETPIVQYGAISTLLSSQGFLFPPSVTAWERDMKTPRVANFSLSIQRNIGWGTVADVGYVGSLGRHLLWTRDLQEIPFGANFDPRNADPTNTRVPLPANFLRPHMGYAGIGYNEAAGSSNYHSLQASAHRRFTRSFDFGFSWTWSKAMGYADADLTAINSMVPRRTWLYGPSDFDRTHVGKLNWVWDLPTRTYGFAPAGVLLNGWQVSGIATFSSGAPVTPGMSLVTATDITGTPSIGVRPVVTGSPVLPDSERTFSRNFRTEVFQMPVLGTVGNTPRNLLRRPGVNNWDIALFKNFRVQERVKVQFRSEFYNAFNHTQFSNFDAGARFDAAGRQVNARFSEYTAARNPRLIQLSLRASF